MALRTRTRSARVLVVALVSVSLATITLDYRQGETGPLAAAGRSALALVSPLQEAVTRITRPVGNFLSALWNLPSLRDENELLREELEAARTQLASQESLEAQLNQALEALGLRQRLRPPSVAATVIATGISNTEWIVTIDVGSDDGVVEGMPVVTGGGALVGHVVRVAPGASDVLLVIDVDSRVASRLVNSRETGILRGMGDADLRMELIDPATDVVAGEAVVTAGYCVARQRGLYPPDVLIGTVSRVVQNPAALEKYVTVRPAIDFSSLEFVTVVKTDPEGRCGGASR